MYGKPYHYGRNSDGRLVLLPGHDPRTIDIDRLTLGGVLDNLGDNR